MHLTFKVSKLALLALSWIIAMTNALRSAEHVPLHLMFSLLKWDYHPLLTYINYLAEALIWKIKCIIFLMQV